VSLEELDVDIIVSGFEIWQEAMRLTANTYRNTAGLPRHELYELSKFALPRCQFK
jgi:hypothetical protein